MNSRRREEDKGLELHFHVSSVVEEARVLEARSGLVFGHFGVRLPRDRLALVWCSGRVESA